MTTESIYRADRGTWGRPAVCPFLSLRVWRGGSGRSLSSGGLGSSHQLHHLLPEAQNYGGRVLGIGTPSSSKGESVHETGVTPVPPHHTPALSRHDAYGVFSPRNSGRGSRLPFRRHIFCWGIPTETGQSGPFRPAPKKGNRAMPRFRPALALAILITLLSLPASAVTSSRTNGNSSRSFFPTLWSALTALFSPATTDGRCGLDPDGRCLPG